MALIEKNNDSKDLVSLYDLSQSQNTGMKGPQNWTLMHQFFPDLVDAQDLVFTQEGNHLIIWESPLKNNLQVYQILFSN